MTQLYIYIYIFHFIFHYSLSQCIKYSYPCYSHRAFLFIHSIYTKIAIFYTCYNSLSLSKSSYPFKMLQLNPMSQGNRKDQAADLVFWGYHWQIVKCHLKKFISENNREWCNKNMVWGKVGTVILTVSLKYTCHEFHTFKV